MNRIEFKLVLYAWWRFFWRYAALFVALLLVGGGLLNLLSLVGFMPQKLFIFALSYGFFANLLATLFTFFYVINRKFKNSPFILSIPNSSSHDFKFYWTWCNYFIRFIFLAFAFAFILGALLPLSAHWLGYDPMQVIKYSKYIGNLAVIPASFLTFLLLMWRKNKLKRKLVFSESIQ